MGLAFKPNIDDLRESPALLVADTLIAESKLDLLLVEPNLQQSTDYELTNYHDLSNSSADIVVYLVAHKEFQGLITNLLELDFCGVKKY